MDLVGSVLIRAWVALGSLFVAWGEVAVLVLYGAHSWLRALVVVVMGCLVVVVALWVAVLLSRVLSGVEGARKVCRLWVHLVEVLLFGVRLVWLVVSALSTVRHLVSSSAFVRSTAIMLLLGDSGATEDLVWLVVGLPVLALLYEALDHLVKLQGLAIFALYGLSADQALAWRLWTVSLVSLAAPLVSLPRGYRALSASGFCWWAEGSSCLSCRSTSGWGRFMLRLRRSALCCWRAWGSSSGGLSGRGPLGVVVRP